MYTVTMASNNYVSKALFEINPTVNVWQLAFPRGAIAFLMMMLKVNTKAKEELWDACDSIDRKLLPFLIFRCFQGGASLFIMFVCIKYFPVSTVGIVCCLAHPITMVLAYVFLEDIVTWQDVLSLIVVFIAVTVIMLGAAGEEADTIKKDVWVTVGLISQPILIAVGTISVK